MKVWKEFLKEIELAIVILPISLYFIIAVLICVPLSMFNDHISSTIMYFNTRIMLFSYGVLISYWVVDGIKYLWQQAKKNVEERDGQS